MGRPTKIKQRHSRLSLPQSRETGGREPADNPTTSPTRRAFEITAAILTGLGKIYFINIVEWKLSFIVVFCLFWAGYVAYRAGRDKSALYDWGFRADNFRSTFLRLLPLALLSIACFFAYGWWTDRLILSWHHVPIFLLYPIWGVIQQFLVMGLVAGNLQDQCRVALSRSAIILVVAVLFAGIHWPSNLLIGGTFLLALVYTHEYLRDRNLWTLGLYHGWLASFFYYFVLERDPWLEAFG